MRERPLRCSVALDLEGVLAATHEATAQASDQLSPYDCPPDDWAFASDDQYDEFMRVSNDLWRRGAIDDILPTVPQVGEITERIARLHDVDVVTHRAQAPKHKLRSWIDYHGVQYQQFVVEEDEKTAIGDYQIHVDDSPEVAQNALDRGRAVVLIDRPYNQHVGPDPALERARDVVQAATVLADPKSVARIATGAMSRP